MSLDKEKNNFSKNYPFKEKLNKIEINKILSQEELDLLKTLAKDRKKLNIYLQTNQKLKKLIESDFAKYIKSLGSRENNGTQRIIKLQKYFGMEVNGNYSIELFKKLINFQRKNNLKIDGIPGGGIMKKIEENKLNDKDFLNILYKLSEIISNFLNNPKINEKINKQKEWNREQSRKYRKNLENNFSTIIEKNIENINFYSQENKEKTKKLLKEIGKDISTEEKYLEKITFYQKKYQVLVDISMEKNLYSIINDLFFKISKINNIELIKDYEKNRIFKKVEVEKPQGYKKRFIERTLNKAKPFLDEKDFQILKQKIYDIYNKGFYSQNPLEYWNNYTILKKFDLKLPYFSHKNKSKSFNAFNSALTYTRIEIMRENLKNLDYNGFNNIKKIIIKQNQETYKKLNKNQKRIFIVKQLKQLYGLSGNIFEHYFNIEKEYGKIIDEIIKEKVKKEQKKYDLLDIYGNKQNIKQTIIKIIKQESFGNPFIYNRGFYSSALGMFQKVEANYDRFKINPFNPKQSIESFLDNILIAFNKNIPKKITETSDFNQKIKISILIHYLGEGNTKKLLKALGGNIDNLDTFITKNKNNDLAEKAQLFLSKIIPLNDKIIFMG